MKFGVCYYVLGSIEPYLEFVEDESLECVIHRVKTNDFTGVRFARTGLDEVPFINICDDKGYCLCRIPVSELQYNSYGYILDNYGDDDSDDVNSAEQGESVDVENTSASDQDNTVENTSASEQGSTVENSSASEQDNTVEKSSDKSLHRVSFNLRFPDNTAVDFFHEFFTPDDSTAQLIVLALYYGLSNLSSKYGFYYSISFDSRY